MDRRIILIPVPLWCQCIYIFMSTLLLQPNCHPHHLWGLMDYFLLLFCLLCPLRLALGGSISSKNCSGGLGNRTCWNCRGWHGKVRQRVQMPLFSSFCSYTSISTWHTTLLYRMVPLVQCHTPIVDASHGHAQESCHQLYWSTTTYSTTVIRGTCTNYSSMLLSIPTDVADNVGLLGTRTCWMSCCSCVIAVMNRSCNDFAASADRPVALNCPTQLAMS